MKSKKLRPALGVVVLVLLASTIVGTPATSSAATASTATEAPALEVIASGLHHPRGLQVLPFGFVLVAESGQEGVEPCLPPSPGTANKAACFSDTGAVSLAFGGRTFRLLEGLASVGAEDGTASSGPHDIALTHKGLQLLYGYANNPELRPDLGEAAAVLGTLSFVDFRGQQSVIGDLAEHERLNNPGGEPGFLGLWSNPYSMVPDGSDTLVSDSGANAILRVTPGGDVSTVSVLPAREVTGPGGNPITMESVPTGMVRGPDGSIYVGELTGFPFPAGGARVFKIGSDGEPEVIATGFTNIIDIGFDLQGRLLVLEIFTNGIPSGDPTGALKRVESDGSVTTLVDTGLITPTAMAVGGDGAVYISNLGTSPVDGQVVRFVPPA